MGTHARRLSRSAILVASLSVVLACVPAVETAPTSPTAPAQPALECQVVLRAHVLETGERAARVVVTAENVGAEPRVIELPDRCPDGPIALEGLAPGYDYYGTCNAGACPGPRASLRVTLEPGRPSQVAEARIDFDGRAPCTGPLEPGETRVVPVAPALELPVCVIGATLEVPPRPAPSPPPREPPRPSPPDPDDPYACRAPQDCVLSCPSVAGCCGFPCGCKHAIHRGHREAYESRYAETCDRPPCPAVGCLREDAIGATCRNGRCVAVTDLGGF